MLIIKVLRPFSRFEAISPGALTNKNILVLKLTKNKKKIIHLHASPIHSHFLLDFMNNSGKLNIPEKDKYKK